MAPWLAAAPCQPETGFREYPRQSSAWLIPTFDLARVADAASRRTLIRVHLNLYWPSDPLDLPFQVDAELLAHVSAHTITQPFQVGGRGLAGVDQEVGVLVGELGRAVQPAAPAGGVDQAP